MPEFDILVFIAVEIAVLRLWIPVSDRAVRIVRSECLLGAGKVTTPSIRSGVTLEGPGPQRCVGQVGLLYGSGEAPFSGVK